MTFFPVSVDELKYDKNRIFTRLKLRADPNTNAYAESIFPYLVELLRENIELVLAYNITDNDLTIASPERSETTSTWTTLCISAFSPPRRATGSSPSATARAAACAAISATARRVPAASTSVPSRIMWSSTPAPNSWSSTS